ncbi:MAG: hypothetical protein HY811_09395 [Planctomycetes bacterium]|nr:hypothetical protein [Planctomycetota bacterium]
MITQLKMLFEQEATLVTLRDELYGGSWARMIKDLRNRMEEKPYIFKLVNRIQADLRLIEKMRQDECKRKMPKAS